MMSLRLSENPLPIRVTNSPQNLPGIVSRHHLVHSHSLLYTCGLYYTEANKLISLHLHSHMLCCTKMGCKKLMYKLLHGGQ